MSKFKIGDRVRALIDEENNGCYYGKIEKGKVYTVTRVSNGCIAVDNQGFAFFNHSFEHVNTYRTKYGIGDVVKHEGKVLMSAISSIRIYNDEVWYTSGFKSYPEEELELYEEPKVKEVTVEELEEHFGCKIKVVK